MKKVICTVTILLVCSCFLVSQNQTYGQEIVDYFGCYPPEDIEEKVEYVQQTLKTAFRSVTYTAKVHANLHDLFQRTLRAYDATEGDLYNICGVAAKIGIEKAALTSDILQI